MTERYSPFVGSSRQQSRLELARTLWTLTHHDHKPVTATIYDVETGRELRVHVGRDERNLIESRLSRAGDAPLEQRARELRAVLLEQGWTVGGR